VNAVTVAALLVAALALALAGALVLVRARDRRRAAPLARDREQSERAAIERQAALERAVVRLESELVAIYGRCAGWPSRAPGATRTRSRCWPAR